MLVTDCPNKNWRARKERHLSNIKTASAIYVRPEMMRIYGKLSESFLANYHANFEFLRCRMNFWTLFPVVKL